MNVRFEYSTVMDGLYHIVTSPDESGLYVAGPTREAARNDAEAVLRIISNDRERRAEAERAAAVRAYG